MRRADRRKVQKMMRSRDGQVGCSSRGRVEMLPAPHASQQVGRTGRGCGVADAGRATNTSAKRSAANQTLSDVSEGAHAVYGRLRDPQVHLHLQSPDAGLAKAGFVLSRPEGSLLAGDAWAATLHPPDGREQGGFSTIGCVQDAVKIWDGSCAGQVVSKRNIRREKPGGYLPRRSGQTRFARATRARNTIGGAVCDSTGPRRSHKAWERTVSEILSMGRASSSIVWARGSLSGWNIHYRLGEGANPDCCSGTVACPILGPRHRPRPSLRVLTLLHHDPGRGSSKNSVSTAALRHRSMERSVQLGVDAGHVGCVVSFPAIGRGQCSGRRSWFGRRLCCAWVGR